MMVGVVDCDRDRENCPNVISDVDWLERMLSCDVDGDGDGECTS